VEDRMDLMTKGRCFFFFSSRGDV